MQNKLDCPYKNALKTRSLILPSLTKQYIKAILPYETTESYQEPLRLYLCYPTYIYMINHQ